MRMSERVQELIRRELGTIVTREVDLTNMIVTFTRVEISSDVNYADIYFVTIPDESSGDALERINKNIFSIQQALNKRLRMRPVPKIRFHIDEGEFEAQKIDEILKGI